MFGDAFMVAITTAAATVMGITELVKRVLKAKGWVAVLLSIVFSFVFTLLSLSQGLSYWLILSIMVALTANGCFKALHVVQK